MENPASRDMENPACGRDEDRCILGIDDCPDDMDVVTCATSPTSPWVTRAEGNRLPAKDYTAAMPLVLTSPKRPSPM